MKAPFESLYLNLPTILSAQADNHWQKLIQHQPHWVEQLDSEVVFKARYCFALSDFIAESCIYNEDIFQRVFVDQDFIVGYEPMVGLIDELDNILDDNQYHIAIRRLRKLLMVAIAAIDLQKRQTIEQSFSLISKLSDRLILSAYRRAYRQVSMVNGTPLDNQGRAIDMSILGMGKLGGGELNFSSDIDLIFCYAQSGQTQGGRKVLDNQQFFVKVAQKLIHYLNHQSADGFVFRVDMRLRPFGDSGPLVMSYSAMEDYYQEQGRDWERYAMLKSRIIGHEQNPYADELQALLRPFVYRRYIDFSVIESLRKMKLLISQEARRKECGINIKLGTGGIREVEFIAQALQMIRGGREKQLQVKSLLLALKRLQQIDELSAQSYQQLVDNYLQLRRCEHYLQQFNDKQTQWLPDDDLNRARLSYLFEVSDWTRCVAKIADIMNAIHQEFRLIIAEPAQEQNELLSPFEVFWQMPDLSSAQALLGGFNEQQQEEFLNRVNQFKNDCQKRSIGGRGRAVLDLLLPQLLCELAQDTESLLATDRVLKVVVMIASRTAYLELLNENLGALKQLVKLCAKSVWIAEQLARQPILLDELIDPAVLYHPIDLNGYFSELESSMIRIPEDDMEQQLEALRHFRLSQQLRIAAADISKVLSVAQVSSHLSAVAQACIESVVNIAWKQMVERYGRPQGRDFDNKGFAVIGYGKLGGTELAYDSDLDVVFIHDCDTTAATDGHKPIDSRQFYLKLAQRIIHIFTSRTVSGVLYDIDTRIRPQGNSGLIACHIKTYEAYLEEEAWTWEHQALVRARLVLGSSEFHQAFSQIRQRILTRQRDLLTLKTEVVQMRQKMRDNLAKGSGVMFDLKQGTGGIADIEFITQYLVLAYASQYPELTEDCRNVKLFDLFAQLNLLNNEQAQKLAHSYRQLRKIGHRLSLQRQDKLTDNEYARELSAEIQQIWQSVFA